jgi:chromosome partitioning protein
MKVIAIVNIKGGAGKTTTCINLCGGLSATGKKVLLVDADPQHSALSWRSMKPDAATAFTVVSIPSGDILKSEVEKIAERSDYEYIVIDCPPGGKLYEQKITRAALMTADLAIVPCQPSGVDYAASEDMIPLLDLALQYKPDLVIRILINRKPPRPAKIGLQARDIAQQVFNKPLFDVDITQRVAVTECTLTGQTIFEYAPRTDSAEEYERLTREVMECLKTSAATAHQS